MPNQTWRRISLGVACLLVGQCLPARVTAQPSPASHLRPAHKVIVERWLKLRPDLRLATEADNKNKEGLAGTRQDRGPNYHPYYAAGDFNGDGKEDFAVVLVKKKTSQWPYVFAIFNGPVGQTARPTFSVDDDLSDGGIFYNPKSPPRQFRLAFGPFESDNCVIVRPRGRTYVTRPCLD